MKKILICLLLALVGWQHPPLQAAVSYHSRSPQTEQQSATPQSRSPKKVQRKAKGIQRTHSRTSTAIAFTLVFSFIAAIALIVLGVIFQLKVMLIAGIVYASILFLLLIAVIILAIGGALSV